MSSLCDEKKKKKKIIMKILPAEMLTQHAKCWILAHPIALRKQTYSNTVDSCYLDPSYLDPITYVELISKSRLFSLYIYCISASRMSNYFYVDTSAISSIIFSP